MKVSIVLPNLNGAGWLNDCIQSLYAQTMQDFELIVIDNASSDKSLTDAKKYIGTPGYTLVENEKNVGFSAAVNAGIAMAKAPYVLLFNNDAFAMPNMLEELVQAMETDERIFAVQSLMLKHQNPKLADDAGDFVTIFGWAYQSGNMLPAKTNDKLKRIFAACGGAALYRRSVLNAIGVFDETFFAYLEDVDIAWRANSLGYKNMLCQRAQCTHIGSATSSGGGGGSYNTFKSVQSGRNSLLYLYKNMPILMFIINFPFTLIGYLLKTLVFHLRGYGAQWRQGMREFFSSVKKIEKPKFRFRNLHHYLWVEAMLVVSTFRFIGWRIIRIFVKDPR